jgi:NAD(P)-dependent dehydrogenase (short-subunit alcohol dehydrogenase family)
MLVQGAGKKGFSNLSFYCASKFGVVGLFESIIDEINPHLYYPA